MAKSKKHHYVPRSLLRNFSYRERRKQVCVFDKKKGSAFCAAIQDVAAENYFNTVVIDGKRVSFEAVFQTCDDRLSSLVGKITKAETLGDLSSDDRWAIAHLAAIQFLRVKIHRSTFNDIPRQLKKELAKHYDGSLDHLGLDSINENSARALSLQRIVEADKLVPAFLEKDWCLYQAPSGEPFWISDNPIVIGNVFPYGDFGLQSAGVEVCWPISQRLLIAFRCPTIANKAEQSSPMLAGHMRSDPIEPCNGEHVMYYNSLQVLRSSRFVYSPNKDFALARRITAEHPEVREQASLIRAGRLGEFPQKEGMPDGTWLVVHGNKTHYMLPIRSWQHHEGGWKVELLDRTPATQAVLLDAPYFLAEITGNNCPGGGMREVDIEEGESPLTLIVQHADPALRNLAEGIGNEHS